MFRRFLPICACVAIIFASASLVGADPLYWDIIYGDGPVISDGAGTWADGGANWNDGVGDVNWNNNAPAIADFGSGQEAWGDLVVTVSEIVKTSGIVSRKQYTFISSGFSYDKIQLEGPTPSIRVFDVTRFNCGITTGEGVESVNLATLDTDTTKSKYLYLYGDNTFDAPLIIGSDPAVAAGVLVMPAHINALGGSSTAGVTVLSGSSVSLRVPEFFTIAKPFTISGSGLAERGALAFYMEYGVELQGSLTLADDAVIEMRADNTISGAISGDYVLWFRNRATSYASSVTLTNSANSTKGLNIASDGNTTAPVTVYLGVTGLPLSRKT